MKKYLLFSALVMGIIFVASFSSYSYAQSAPVQTELVSEFETFVFVQTLLENSDGKVVTYLTSDKFTDLNKAALQKLLDKEVSEKDPIIEINSEKFQVIKRKLSITYDKENVMQLHLI